MKNNIKLNNKQLHQLSCDSAILCTQFFHHCRRLCYWSFFFAFCFSDNFATLKSRKLELKDGAEKNEWLDFYYGCLNYFRLFFFLQRHTILKYSTSHITFPQTGDQSKLLLAVECIKYARENMRTHHK